MRLDIFPESSSENTGSTNETIGKRIARLRQEHSWTQETLAQRLAMSRVAVSHIEMDLSLPGERTITLLAGLFKISPQALVAGSSYPPAKAERLPLSVCSFTHLEVALALLQNDVGWLDELTRLGASQMEIARRRRSLFQIWNARLSEFDQTMLDDQAESALAAARQQLLLIYQPG